jgi:translation elongation factor EF-G
MEQSKQGRKQNLTSEDSQLLKTLLTRLEALFQEKLDVLTTTIQQSMQKNEDSLKKQVQAMANPISQGEQLEQIKYLIEKLEQTFHEKVDILTRKIDQSGNYPVSSSFIISHGNREAILRQLEELERLIDRKLDRTVQTIHQYVADSVKSVEEDLKGQISVIRRELFAEKAISSSAIIPEIPESEEEVIPKARIKAAPKPEVQIPVKPPAKPEVKTRAKTPTFPQLLTAEDYDQLSLRKLKLIGKQRKIRGYARMKRPEILIALKQSDDK